MDIHISNLFGYLIWIGPYFLCLILDWNSAILLLVLIVIFTPPQWLILSYSGFFCFLTNYSQQTKGQAFNMLKLFSFRVAVTCIHFALPNLKTQPLYAIQVVLLGHQRQQSQFQSSNVIVEDLLKCLVKHNIAFLFASFLSIGSRTITWKLDCKCCWHDPWCQILFLRYVSFVLDYDELFSFPSQIMG